MSYLENIFLIFILFSTSTAYSDAVIETDKALSQDSSNIEKADENSKDFGVVEGADSSLAGTKLEADEKKHEKVPYSPEKLSLQLPNISVPLIASGAVMGSLPIVLGLYLYWGVYSFGIAGKATVAIVKECLRKDLTIKEKLYGTGFYFTYYRNALLFVGTNVFLGLKINKLAKEYRAYKNAHDSSYWGKPRSTKAHLYKKMLTIVPGFSAENTKSGMRSLYKKGSMMHHPDKGGDEETFKSMSNTYSEYFKAMR